MDAPEDWLAIEYRVFADFPRAFFVNTTGRWLFALAKFKESSEDSAPFEVYDMGELSPADLGRAWSSAADRSVAMLGKVTLTPDSFDESRRQAVRAAALHGVVG